MPFTIHHYFAKSPSIKNMKISDHDKELWLSANKETKLLKKQDTIYHNKHITKPSAKKQLPTIKSFTNNIHKDQKQGTFKIEARIDLHGYSMQNAYENLIKFVEDCYRFRKQNLMVITGHGDNFISIKREFCIWVENPSIKKYIISVKEAHPKQGGAGAYYVILRRNHNG